MTVGPDLGWLADAEGNLRPEVARDLLEAPAPPAPGARVAMPVPAPAATAAPAGRPTPGPVTRTAPALRPSLPVVPLLLGVIAVLIGFSFGGWFARRPIAPPAGLDLHPAMTPAGRAAFVNGASVNVRSGPGISFPLILKLTAGEGVLVGAEQSGWFGVTTNSGMSGWVFGAFLRGHGSAEQGAAIVTRLLTSNGSAQLVVLRPGDKVFVVRNGDGQTDVILPTGQRLRVAPEAILRVD